MKRNLIEKGALLIIFLGLIIGCKKDDLEIKKVISKDKPVYTM